LGKVLILSTLNLVLNGVDIMNTETEMLSLVAGLAKAKSEQNIAEALKVYHPDAVMVAPGLGGQAKGHSEIDQQPKVFFRLLPDYRVELGAHAFKGEIMLATGKVIASLNVLEKDGPSIVVPAFFEFHFSEQKISREVFHLDAGILSRKSGVKIEEIFKAMALYTRELDTASALTLGA